MSPAVWAQQAPDAGAAPKPVDCAQAALPKDVSRCFVERHERAVKLAAERRARDAERAKSAEARQTERKEQQTAAEVQAEAEKQTALSISRGRHTSNLGKRYRVSYGVALEPRVREPK